MALRITGGLGCINERAFEFCGKPSSPLAYRSILRRIGSSRYATKKPRDHIATTLAKRRLTVVSISPDSPGLYCLQVGLSETVQC